MAESKDLVQGEQHGDLTPYDVDPATFSKALERRNENRKSMIQWVKQSLQKGRDYGTIVGKDSLWKPGAEKICGMLGLKVMFPNLTDYEQAAVNGAEIKNIIIRCQLVDSYGNVVAEGVGARSVEKEHGDINKALKMACKSAHIDATLRCAGLSEIFSQDLEDMSNIQPGPGAPPAERHTSEAPPGIKKVTESQVRLLRARLRDTTITEDLLKEYFSLEHLSDLPFAKMDSALEYLNQHKK